MILHIPHASVLIPENFRDQILLSDKELSEELLLMTDWFVDELFEFPMAAVVRFPISRLLVDVERFPDDADEPMSRVGMGIIYTSTAYGRQLKMALLPEERRLMLSQYYESHHYELEKVVREELVNIGKALIVDCHSFPSHPLPCDPDQSTPRPDFCIGKNPFHTPDSLVAKAKETLTEMGHSPAVNRPYSGTIVPVAFLEDPRVSSIMIEVNRCLYMDEETGEKREDFLSVKRTIRCLLDSLAMSWWGLPIESPFFKSESEAKSLAAALLKEEEGR